MKEKIELEEAKSIADDVVDMLLEYAEKIEVVGSIRRRKPIVHDIDIVTVPKPFFVSFGVLKLPDVKIKRMGEKLIEFEYRDVQVDVYLADEDSFEVVKLIRTGSTEHNKKLCVRAISKGMKLHADGRGLWKGSDLVSDTERGILEELLGCYVEPENRD